MKQKNLLLIPVLALFAWTSSFAQNADHRSTISATAGLNIFQFLNLIDGALSDSLGSEVKIKATASYGLNYDYGVTNWFSIGLATGYNKLSVDADNVEIAKEDGSIYVGRLNLDASRTNIALRPLFHYGNKGRFDLYSGFRIGANIWSVKIDAEEDLNPEDIGDVPLRSAGATLGFQFIPFGMRGYMTENIGLGFEIGIGGPHYAALQLNYRM